MHKGVTMKLQLALDTLHSDEALSITGATLDYVDVIEINTPLIKHEGVSVIQRMKDHFPEKPLLVDLKSMIAGEYETAFCFEAGCDIVTVCGLSDISTIRGARRSALKSGREVMVDLLNVPDKIDKAREMSYIGVDYIKVHTGIELQSHGYAPLADLKSIRAFCTIPVAVTGDTDELTIDEVIAEEPDVIVVSSSITGSVNPKESARLIKEKMTRVSEITLA